VAKKKTTKGKKAKTTAVTTPQIKPSKDTMSQAELLRETVAVMDDPVSIKQRKDFLDSMKSVIDDAISEGRAVNMFGLVKLTPRLHTKGVREVNEVFGDPTSKKVKKNYAAKTTLKVTALKPLKDALPNANKMAKKVG
jgi:hypothetical protein